MITGPGGQQVNTDAAQSLANGLAWYALITCVIGIIVSASLWAVGSKGQNPGQELTGKKGLVLCCTAAFVIGFLPTWINYLSDAGDKIAAQPTPPATAMPGAVTTTLLLSIACIPHDLTGLSKDKQQATIQQCRDLGQPLPDKGGECRDGQWLIGTGIGMDDAARQRAEVEKKLCGQ